MKALLVLLACLVGASLSQIPPKNAKRTIDQAFRARRFYTYRYESQVNTGNEPSSKLFTGFKFSCLARVYFLTHSAVRVSFDEISLFNFEQPVTEYEASENLHPDVSLREIVGPDALAMREYLGKAFEFTYENGHVLKLILHGDEPWWSANAKKAFTSLFEVNLDKRFQMSLHFPVDRTLENELYTVLEESPEGECATVYDIKKHRVISNEMFVRKTRDFDNCVERPTYLSPFLHGMVTPEFWKTNPLSIQSHVEYNLNTIGKSKFLIANAMASEWITYSPYTENLMKGEQPEFKTTVNQTLFLIGDGLPVINEDVPAMAPEKAKTHTLRMIIPGLQVQYNENNGLVDEVAQNIGNKYDVYTADKIYAVIRLIAENTIELTSEHALTHLKVASDMLRTTPKPVLDKVWNRLRAGRKDPVDDFAAKVFFDLLPSIGSEPCAELVLEICHKERTMETNCTVALNVIALKAPAIENLVVKLLKLINDRRPTFSPAMKRASYLTLGSFGYKVVTERDVRVDNLNKAEDILTPLRKQRSRVLRSVIRDRIKNIRNLRVSIINDADQIAERIVRILSRLVQKGNMEDKVLGLKACGNSGLHQCTRVYKKMLLNREEPLMLRLMAINGYKRFANDDTAKSDAVQTVFKVFLDTKETHEIRNTAFVTLINLQPTMPIWEKIVESLHHEKDADVSSFVLSFMHEIANSTVEPIWPLTKNFSDALKSAPTYKNERTRSFFKYLGGYWPQYKWGKALSLTAIRALPRYEGWSVNFDSMDFGIYEETLEVGVKAVGFGPLIDKVLSIFGQKTRANSSPHKIIRNIIKDLKIVERTTELPNGHIYLKIFGHELNYFDLTDIFRDILAGNMENINRNVKVLQEGIQFFYKAAGFFGNSKLTLPSAAAFPISAWCMTSYNIKTEGKFVVDMVPTLVGHGGDYPLMPEFSLEMNPKVTVGYKNSMGLDAFFIKSTHGYHSVATFDVPIEERLAIDQTYSKFRWVHTNPKIERPFFAIQSEPISERLTITTAKTTPVVMHEKNVILAPTGERVKPLYVPYYVNSIGHKFLMVGQVPRSWTNLMMPLKGRTDVRFFFLPLEDPAETVTIRGQYVYAYDKDMGISKARTMNDMEEDISQPTGPMDIRATTVTMEQLVRKMEEKCGKTIKMHDWSLFGFIVTMEAHGKDTERQCELTAYFSSMKHGEMTKSMMHFLRTPIAGYDEETFEWVSDIDVKYPTKVARPLDVLSVDFQREILKELNWHFGFRSSQMINGILNNTILSVIEQNDFSYLAKGPSHKIVDALLPHHMYRMMNFTHWKEFPKNWIVYWRDLLPMFDQMREENKLSLDPYFLSREGMLHHKMNELLNIQYRLKKDIWDVLRSGKVNNAEVPVMQWLVMKQVQVCGFFSKVIAKDYPKGKIDHVKEFVNRLQHCFYNANDLLQLMGRVLTEIEFLTTETDEIVRGATFETSVKEARLDIDEENTKHAGFWSRFNPFTSNSEDEVDEDEVGGSRYDTFDYRFLLKNLFKLSLHQHNVLKQLQEQLVTHNGVDLNMLDDLLIMYNRNMTLLNAFFRKDPIHDEIFIDQLLLLTVQNEHIIWILTYTKEMDAVQGISSSLLATTETHEWSIAHDRLLFKLSGTEFATTVSYVVKDKQAREIMTPIMPKNYFPFWEQVQSVKRQLMVEMYEFRSKCANNVTCLKDPTLAEPVVKDFLQDIKTISSTLLGITHRMVETTGRPPLYLFTELMECIRSCGIAVEYAEKSVLPVSYENRFDWYKDFAELNTEIHVLLGEMNPLFTKLSQPFRPQADQVSIFDEIPMNLDITNIQDIVIQQTYLKDQIVHYTQIRDEPIEVQEKALEDAMRKANALYERLREEKPRMMVVLDKHSKSDISIISTPFLKAVHDQLTILEMLRTCVHKKSTILQNASDFEQKIDDNIEDCTAMETEINNKLNEVSLHNEDKASYTFRWDENSNMSENDENILVNDEDNQPEESTRLEFPTSVVGSVNVTWGTMDHRNKKATIKFMSMRSVEQVFRLYKQMHSLYRNPEVVDACNDQLQGRYFEDNTLRTTEWLNTFNHIYTATKYDDNEISDWLKLKALMAKDYLKTTFWHNYQIDKACIESTRTHDEFHLVQEISDFNKKFDLYLMTDSETNKYMDVPETALLDAILPRQGRVRGWETWTRHIPVRYQSPKCYLNMNQLQTFDHVSYTLSSEGATCEYLLAMDCSPLKSFAISMIKTNSSLTGHALRMINTDKVVDVIPHMLDIEVKVSGESLELKESQAINFYDQMRDQTNKPSVTVIKEGIKVTVAMPSTGVTVYIMGTAIEIEVSNLFSSRMCGLCSNLDSETSWEYVGPKMEVYNNPTAFVQSFAFPSCPMVREQLQAYDVPNVHMVHKSDRKDIYRLKGSDPKYPVNEEDEKTAKTITTEMEKKECKPKMGYLVKDWRSKVRQETCITVHRVPTCPFDCLEKKKTKKERIEFICIDSKSQELPHIRHVIDDDLDIIWEDYPRLSTLKPRSRYYRVPEICTDK